MWLEPCGRSGRNMVRAQISAATILRCLTWCLSSFKSGQTGLEDASVMRLSERRLVMCNQHIVEIVNGTAKVEITKLFVQNRKCDR